VLMESARFWIPIASLYLLELFEIVDSTLSQKNRTPVTFSNNSNNPGSISTKFGTKNGQLIGI